MGNPAAVQDPANASTTTSHESCPAGKEASSPTKRDEEVSKLVEVILHRPFNRAITHHRIRRPSPFVSTEYVYL